jgi:hypothetical protein
MSESMRATVETVVSEALDESDVPGLICCRSSLSKAAGAYDAIAMGRSLRKVRRVIYDEALKHCGPMPESGSKAYGPWAVAMESYRFTLAKSILRMETPWW